VPWNPAFSGESVADRKRAFQRELLRAHFDGDVTGPLSTKR
jgi:hypothetical protein